MPIKAFQTLLFAALPVVLLKRHRWVEVVVTEVDNAVAVVAIPMAHGKCTMQLAAIVENLVKFRSNHGWIRQQANQLNQFIATIVIVK